MNKHSTIDKVATLHKDNSALAAAFSKLFKQYDRVWLKRGDYLSQTWAIVVSNGTRFSSLAYLHDEHGHTYGSTLLLHASAVSNALAKKISFHDVYVKPTAYVMHSKHSKKALSIEDKVELEASIMKSMLAYIEKHGKLDVLGIGMQKLICAKSIEEFLIVIDLM